MPIMGNFDISEFKNLQKNLQKLSDPVQLNKFFIKCVQEMAIETLIKVIKNTPVADSIKIQVNVLDDLGNKVQYKSGKNKGKYKTKFETIHIGGTLRRGWIAKTESEAESSKQDAPQENEIKEYAYKLKVAKVGKTYVAWLINPVEYASYVENGHRQTPGRYVKAIGKRLKVSWVPGRHMLLKSMTEVENSLPQFLEELLQKYLDGVFGG